MRIEDCMVRARKDVLYMAVTTDKFRLPVAVAGSIDELAKLRKIDPAYIRRELRKHRNKPRFVAVSVGEMA